MSRLLRQGEDVRERLLSRNLYTPNNIYDVNNPRVVDVINTLSRTLRPFNAFDLGNTFGFRLIGPNTPIQQIGVRMLIKQLGYTAASRGSAEFLPSINFGNLFDGNPNTKLITRKIDFSITRRESQTTLGRIIQSITGFYRPINPFTKNPTIEDYINNTGNGQLDLLTTNINKNIYKNNDILFTRSLRRKDFNLFNGSELLREFYYTNNNLKFKPYFQYISPLADEANLFYRNSLIKYLKSKEVNSYGDSQEFIDDLGKIYLRNNNSQNGSFEFISENYGLNEDIDQQLIWGRNGLGISYRNERFQELDGSNVTNGLNRRKSIKEFNIKNGLLLYTKELLNSQGKYSSFDITKKTFLDKNNQLHFNGSPLDTKPSGEKDYSRRNSILDPYNRFAKAIRFDGNIMYGGNQNSTIYRSVIPKIHPIFTGSNERSNKNLTFSIENLAFTIKKGETEGVYIVDNDVYNTVIPECEVGQFGGRLMWFPPYDIKLNEQTIARYEGTNFIGRGEPVYTYSNSERIANLSFKLLIDYPPQVMNYRNRDDFHKVISEFYAFGGEPTNDVDFSDVIELEKKLEELNEEYNSISDEVELAPLDLPFGSTLEFYFPNDLPRSGGVTNSIEQILSSGYEDGIFNPSIDCENDWGLNTSFLQSIDDFISKFLNPEPNNNNEYSNIEFTNIYLAGSATKLYQTNPSLPNERRLDIMSSYNKELSRRRIDAVEAYINKRFKEIFNTSKSISEYGVRFTKNVMGADLSSDENATKESICSLSAKMERSVTIIFQSNGKVPKKSVNNTVKDRENKEKIREEIQSIETKLDKAKKRVNEYNKCYFENLNKVNDGILKGFKSVKDNKYYPVFHSQTPEDFHRRLTFLQQCMKQGASVRRIDENGELVSPRNSVFGRMPICVLRIGDFYHTKVIIENLSINYDESTWDLNPEGMGMQPMIADVSLTLKIIGGQSLRGPIDVLQNAISFNYYANSTYYETDVYSTAKAVENEQYSTEKFDE